MELIVVPLASKLHGREYYGELLGRVKEVFERYGIRVLDVIESEVGLNEAAVGEVSNSVPVILFLTGGTSRLAVELVSRANLGRILTLSHSGHNSLASAISARVRVEVEGVAVRNYFCRELGSECLGIIERVVKVGRALARVLGVKVGVIGEGLGEDVKNFEETLGAEVSLIGYEELAGLTSSVRDDEVSEVLSMVEQVVDTSGADYGMVREAVRVYVAMRRLAVGRGLDALAIDCFPYLVMYGVTPCLAVSLLNGEGLVTACEADLRALTLMLMASALGVKGSWIANTASVSGNRLTLAHCTIATGFGTGCRLLPHFESGKPYSLTCSLSEGTYTLAGLDRGYSLVAVLRGELVRSGLLDSGMCRTQAVLEASVDLRDFPNIALSNHHVLIPGDVADDLRELSYLLFMDFTTYESVIRHTTGEL